MIRAAFAALLLGALPASAALRGAPARGGRAPAVRRAPAMRLSPLSPALASPRLLRPVPALAASARPGAADGALRAEARRQMAERRAFLEARAAAPASAARAEAPLPAAEAAKAGFSSPAEAIAESGSVDQALSRLVDMGALRLEDVPADDAPSRLALLHRVWERVSPAYTAARLPVDSSWAVPAIKVERGARTFYVHGVAHGQHFPPNLLTVRRLVAQVRERGHALQSEENFPLHYGYAYGLETLDVKAWTNGARTRIVPAAQGLPHRVVAWTHAAAAGGLLGAALAGWGATVAPRLHEPQAWLVTAGLALFLWLLSRGFQPWFLYKRLVEAAKAELRGEGLVAERIRRVALALHKPRIAAEDILRLHLPPGPGAYSDVPHAWRSDEMAAAALSASAAAGAMHLLVGASHAAHIAWRLATAPLPRRINIAIEDPGGAEQLEEMLRLWAERYSFRLHFTAPIHRQHVHAYKRDIVTLSGTITPEGLDRLQTALGRGTFFVYQPGGKPGELLFEDPETGSLPA